MKKYLLLLFVSYSFLYSQEVLIYRQGHNLLINNLVSNSSYMSDTCTNITDYCFSSDKVFVIAKSNYQNKKLCENKYYNKLLYSWYDFNDLLNMEFIELPVKDAYKLYLNPNSSELIVKTLSNNLFLINETSLSCIELNILENPEIIGWWDIKKILFKNSNRFYTYDIETCETKIIFELEELKYYTLFDEKNTYTKIDSNSFILAMYDKYLDNGVTLFYYDSVTLKKIYTASGFFLDFVLFDRSSLFILDSRVIASKGDVEFLTKINLNGNIIDQMNLTDELGIQSKRSIFRLCNDIVNNKIIFIVYDVIVGEKDGFYELDLIDTSRIKQLIKKNLLSIEDIQIRELIKTGNKDQN